MKNYFQLVLAVLCFGVLVVDVGQHDWFSAVIEAMFIVFLARWAINSYKIDRLP